MRQKGRRLLMTALAVTVGAAVSAWGGVPVALAQSAALERAGELRDAGARAYALGKYEFAIQAFEQAYGLALGDELLFSIAQAHRQRYALERSPDDLSQAISHYRRYLQVAPNGSHHAEAQRAIEALEPELQGEPVAAPRRTAVARLSVMSSALDASVRVDGGPARSLPLFVEIAPGKHTVAVRAPGYIELVREIQVAKGSVYPVSVALVPQPAKLTIAAPSGAAVHVDGKLAGTAPLAKPIDVDPGKHFVSVTQNGFVSHAEEVRLERGQATRLSVELAATRQRKVSWALIAGGGAGIAGGIVLGVASLVQIRKARDIERRAGGPLDADEQERRDAALSARDDFRVGSGFAAGAGLALFLVGGALHVLDAPLLPSPPTTPRRGRAPRGVEVSAVPAVGPGLTGAAFTMGF